MYKYTQLWLCRCNVHFIVQLSVLIMLYNTFTLWLLSLRSHKLWSQYYEVYSASRYKWTVIISDEMSLNTRRGLIAYQRFVWWFYPSLFTYQRFFSRVMNQLFTSPLISGMKKAKARNMYTIHRMIVNTAQPECKFVRNYN